MDFWNLLGSAICYSVVTKKKGGVARGRRCRRTSDLIRALGRVRSRSVMKVGDVEGLADVADMMGDDPDRADEFLQESPKKRRSRG